MAIATRPPDKTLRASTNTATAIAARENEKPWYRRVSWFAWVALLAALVLFDTYLYQVQLVPQTQSYAPNWYGARWITATDGSASVGYFRRSFTLNAVPTGGFVTIQADQSFYLYVNGTGIDQSQDDFYAGMVNRAYNYDITPYLTKGLNTVAVKVNQHDDGHAGLRAVVGLRYGTDLQALGTDSIWRATGDSSLTTPTETLDRTSWYLTTFSDAAWNTATYLGGTPPPDGVLRTNPAAVETPLPPEWITAGSGADGYFRTKLTLPTTTDAWISLATTGQTEVYVNGHAVLDQPAFIHVDESGIYTTPSVPMTAGMYNMTPFFTSGTNDVAIHVISTGSDQAAVTFELFVTTPSGAVRQFVADTSWQASETASGSWLQDTTSLGWAQALQVNVSSFSATQPLKRVPLVQASPDVNMSAQNVLLNSLLLLVPMAAAFLVFGGRASAFSTLRLGLLNVRSRRPVPLNADEAGNATAMERVALALAPGVLLLLGLWMVSRESLLPKPWPFATGLLWLAVIVTLASFVAVWRGTRRAASDETVQVASKPVCRVETRSAASTASAATSVTAAEARRERRNKIIAGLCVTALTLFGLWMVRYDLSYEPYWQDELASLLAAKGVLATGLPRFLGGYLYPKAELYSYILAFVMKFFGDNPADTRMIAVVEYTISIPVTYLVAKFFAGRRVALLATALVVTSAMTLRWGQEARMYQQAELCLLVVVYLFYRALQPGDRVRYIYLSMAALLVMYFSHEETFIVLPAVLGYFIWSQVAYLAVARDRWMSDSSWWRGWWRKRRHWVFAGLPVIAIIGVQYYITKHSGFPLVGSDATTQPLLSYSIDSVVFYWRLLFDTQGLPLRYGGYELGFLSVLALIAVARGLVLRDRPLRYLSLFVCLPVLMLVFVFSLQADRYFYPLFPEFAILAASSVIWLVAHCGSLARRLLTVRTARMVTAAFTVIFVVAVIWSQTFAISQFGIAVSRTLDLPYRHAYPLYDLSGAYIQAHWQPGDIEIASAPTGDAEFYSEPPDYYLYRGKALYIYQTDGHIYDSDTAAQVIINEDELQSIVSSHTRVWIYAAQSYDIVELSTEYPALQGFVLVYEADDAFVYLKT